MGSKWIVVVNGSVTEFNKRLDAMLFYNGIIDEYEKRKETAIIYIADVDRKHEM